MAAGVHGTYLCCGAMLLTAVLVLWRRDLKAIIGIYTLQGMALAALVAVLAAERGSVELWVMAVVVLLVRGGVLPWLLRRTQAPRDKRNRETAPSINVAASLVLAAGLVLLSYAVCQPLVRLAPSTATRAVPIAVAVVLIGLEALVTRRRALSQVVGFLLMDNGITAVGFLTTSGAGVIVEAGIALDVLLAVLVLQILATRITETFGDTDLDGLRELRD